jgi:hypothetical protein
MSMYPGDLCNSLMIPLDPLLIVLGSHLLTYRCCGRMEVKILKGIERKSASCLGGVARVKK